MWCWEFGVWIGVIESGLFYVGKDGQGSWKA